MTHPITIKRLSDGKEFNFSSQYEALELAKALGLHCSYGEVWIQSIYEITPLGNANARWVVYSSIKGGDIVSENHRWLNPRFYSVQFLNTRTESEIAEAFQKVLPKCYIDYPPSRYGLLELLATALRIPLNPETNQTK